jgi:hypothetical protein
LGARERLVDSSQELNKAMLAASLVRMDYKL